MWKTLNEAVKHTCHSRTVLSPEADDINPPTGLIRTHMTDSEWPWSTLNGLMLDWEQANVTFHNLTKWSWPPVASRHSFPTPISVENGE